MRRPALRFLPLALAFAFVSTSDALPPGEARFREGANHKVGDDSFVERFGRAPGEGDREALRMRMHLEHARARLAAAPPTRPELGARRAELLGYLGEYIAKGITPQNTRLPWRTPVFIDDFDNICAVGYLIERSVGRALPERIAAQHRHDYLEDIAGAMPEVRAWIESSGLTLDELASIQPGYEAPMVEQWSIWALGGKVRPADGPYERELPYEGITTRGTFRGGQMNGVWTRTDRKGRVHGSGQLARGRGTWHSFYPDGKRLAAGPYDASLPHGAWTFYHPSGHVAAEGRFEHGSRAGTWRFYYDTKAKTPIAAGGYGRGASGRWRHFDERGELIAVSTEVTPSQWQDTFGGGHLLEVMPYASGVQHVMHRGNVNVSDWRLDGFFLGDEKIYVQSSYDDDERIYDADGHQLEKAGGAWLAHDCRWSRKRKAIAKHGDITTLHGLLYSDGRRDVGDGHGGRECGEPVAVSAGRGARIDQLLATRSAVRTPSPELVKQAALHPWENRDEEETAEADEAAEGAAQEGTAEAEQEQEQGQEQPAKSAEQIEEEQRAAAEEEDLTKVLAAAMGWYVEFPHIDGRFIQVYYTLPGFTPGLYNAEFADDDGE
jgi:hypothetical protein